MAKPPKPLTPDIFNTLKSELISFPVDCSHWGIANQPAVERTYVRANVEKAVFTQGNATEKDGTLTVCDAVAEIIFTPISFPIEQTNQKFKESKMSSNEPKTEIIKALLEAQKAFQAIPMDKENSFYKGHKYASLSSILNSVIPALNAQGLYLSHCTRTEPVQMPVEYNGNPIATYYEEGGVRDFITKGSPSRIFVEVTCQILHTSGQEFSTKASVVVEGKNLVQSIGIAITYLRRYTVSALLGLYTETDDDGNMLNPKQTVTKKPQTKKKPAVQFSKAAIDVVMEAGKYESVNHVNAILNLSQEMPKDVPADIALAWHKKYRETRDVGLEPKPSAQIADAYYLKLTSGEQKYDELVD